MDIMIIVSILFFVLLVIILSIYIRVGREKKVQDETISFTTHQLRSPITAVKGYASIILNEEYGKLSDELREPLKAIMRSSEQLSVLVEEYREFGKLEKRKLNLNYEKIEIGEFIKEVVEESKIEVEKNKHVIDFNCESLIPSGAIDKGRIRQVLCNVIENAIRYTPINTKISVDVKYEEPNVLITISDSGPGVPEEELEIIFEKYKRGEYGIATGSGTGLGLYIARTIIRSHGGDILATRSEQLGGASFQIEIPLH